MKIKKNNLTVVNKIENNDSDLFTRYLKYLDKHCIINTPIHS